MQLLDLQEHEGSRGCVCVHATLGHTRRALSKQMQQTDADYVSPFELFYNLEPPGKRNYATALVHVLTPAHMQHETTNVQTHARSLAWRIHVEENPKDITYNTRASGPGRVGEH